MNYFIVSYGGGPGPALEPWRLSGVLMLSRAIIFKHSDTKWNKLD